MWELGAARHSRSRARGFGAALEPEQLPGDVEAGGPQMRVRVQQTSAGGRPLRNSEHRGALSRESFLTSSAGRSRDSQLPLHLLEELPAPPWGLGSRSFLAIYRSPRPVPCDGDVPCVPKSLQKLYRSPYRGVGVPEPHSDGLDHARCLSSQPGVLKQAMALGSNS